jgi:ABC-type uncharacterized transport system ATPase component
MQFQTKAKVLGAKCFNDTIDGQKFDSTTIFVEMALDESRGTAKGFASQNMGWGSSEEFQKIKHLPFPFEAELTVELVTSGKTQKQRIVALKPIGAARPGA